MALIHERLNRDEGLDQLDFREYAEALSRDLFYCYQRGFGIGRFTL